MSNVNKFQAVECIRDFTLSKAIMQNIQVMIEIENTTRGFDLRQYAEIDRDGYVTRCALILIEPGCASVLFTQDMPLGDSEALVKKFHPDVGYIQCFTKGEEKTLPTGWGLVSANFKSRISIPFTEYRIEDTDHPVIKQCHFGGGFGSTLFTVVGSHMTVVLKDEPIERNVQLSIDLVGGVAVAESKDMSVRCMTEDWAKAFDQNPNYVFHNAMIGKRLN